MLEREIVRDLIRREDPAGLEDINLALSRAWLRLKRSAVWSVCSPLGQTAT